MVNVCQPGSNLLSAGYCMYSSSVILVVSLGKGVRRPRRDCTHARSSSRLSGTA